MQVNADMHFLGRLEKYLSEKPYSLRYPPSDKIPQSNVEREKHILTITSIRGLGDLGIDTYGFDVIILNSKMKYEDFSSEESIKSIYLSESCETLRKHLNAKWVVPFDFAVRRRHSSFPISTGEDYEADQPTAMAHIDFSNQEGARLLRRMFGDRAGDILKDDWKIVNTWKPLRGPVNDWPLALCDSRTISHTQDTMAGDIVYPDWFTENVQVQYSPGQQWYYLPDHATNEVIIFKSAESNASRVQSTPHASFYNPLVKKDEPPRESIDCRFFVLYSDLEDLPLTIDNVASM
ncbi:hypothetical protein GGS23DRAFT_608388 [Durotheca rogersii]|uniref:uncharacterized protein n=1 Tax=Durotheca rogersii TaxID=419775 RepID=UPI00221EF5E0|nr:uncharacterized protein GGS23DRAFT_608388 [Durotheca rogersii]KAI5853291.1 hypothetical protein GGS23DRAFT_608388 [Durotheca rogersii]